MKKRQLEHLLRASGRILEHEGVKEFIIIGSQSLHGSFPDLPDQIVVSVEADLIAESNVAVTEYLNVIGIDSPFHESHGIYVDPVDENTAILPAGWRDRLIPLESELTEGVRGLCLELHDLAISKYAAGRRKDRVFNKELVVRGLLKQQTLLQRLADTNVQPALREIIATQIRVDFLDAKE